MEITVNFDTVDGTQRTFRTCEIDWDVFTEMTAYTEIYNETKIFPGIDDPVKCITFYQSNGDFGGAFSGLPDSEIDTNTLNDYANTFTFTSNVFHSDFAANTANYEQLTIGTMPNDWGMNPHFMRRVLTYSAFDSYDVDTFIPVSMNEVWNNAEQYYLDKTGKMVQLICLKNGYKFTTSKGRVGAATSPISYKAGIVGCAYTFEPFVLSDPDKLYRTNYVLTYNNTDFSMTHPVATWSFPDRSYFQGVEIQPIQNNNIVFNVFISAEISDVKYIGLASIVYNTETQKYTDIGGFLLSENFWTSQFEPEPPDWGDDTTTGGGHGTHTAPSDNRGDGTSSYFDDDTTGLVTIINSNIATALALNQASGYSIHQILPDHMKYIYKELYTPDYFRIWTNTMFNPLSAILNVHMIPPEFINPDIVGADSHLTAAGYDISTAINDHEHVAASYPTLGIVSHYHVGTIQLTNRVFDAFPDFAPYTTAVLHLPYIGQIEIDVNAIMYGAMSVDYVCDVTNGNCTAFVWCKDRNNTRTFKYIASGNCSYSIPLYAYNQDGSAMQKMINAAGSTIGGMIGGNVLGMVGGVAEIADAYMDMRHTQRDTQITGSLSGNNAMISDGVCWLEIIRPVWANPANYQQLHGETSEISGTIKADSVTGTPYSGFTIISEIDLDTVDALPDEKSEIAELLKSGVYIRGELLS